MSLAYNVFMAVSGSKSMASPDNVKGMVGRLIQTHGSKSAAARSVGVSEAAIRRWEKGAKPRNRAGLVSAYRRAILPAGREASIRAGVIALDLEQDRRHRLGTRKRVVDGKGMDLAPGTGDKVMDAYLRGDDAGAAAALKSGIRDSYYQGAIMDRDDDVPEDDGYGLY